MQGDIRGAESRAEAVFRAPLYLIMQLAEIIVIKLKNQNTRM